jgi:hypothetical protein
MQTPQVTAPPSPGRTASVWTWFLLVVGATFWASTGRPLKDPDIWWHVRTGQLILDHGIPHREPWAFTAIGNTWVPTAWLSDVVLAMTHDFVGWSGIVALKVIASGILLWLFGRDLLKVSSPRVAAPIFVFSLLTLAPFLSERPQLISLIFVIWLGKCIRTLLATGQLPWRVLAFTYLWANLHAMWVLVPAALGVAAIGLVVDRAPFWREAALRCMVFCLGSVAAAALTPVGPRLAIWSLVVRNAASDISEWQPTVFANRHTIGFLLVFLVWAAAVARSNVQAPRSEAIWMIAVMIFVTQAGRNVAPGIVLIAPMACLAADRAWGTSLRAHAEPLIPKGIMSVTSGLAVLGCLAFSLSSPALAAGLPNHIVAILKDRPSERVRVLNSYNVGGYLTGMGAPKISVAIDGRTDNYDPQFVHRYLTQTSSFVTAERLIRKLDPDVAVLGKTSTLAKDLQRHGWRKTLVDGDFVLLDRPSSSRLP